MSGYHVCPLNSSVYAWFFFADYTRRLAYTELYLTLGMMFRRYKYELHEADVTDVELGHDFFIPVTRLDSKGVRVFVEATSD